MRRSLREKLDGERRRGAARPRDSQFDSAHLSSESDANGDHRLQIQTTPRGASSEIYRRFGGRRDATRWRGAMASVNWRSP